MARAYKRVSHYLLKEKLGEGQYGVVYIGEDLTTGEVRAIKRIKKVRLAHDSSFKNQMREIEIMRLLNHENIVRLYDYTSTSKHLYLVMEFCSGKDLTHQRSVGEQTTLHYLRQLVAGLNILKLNRIAHRDLKPANILLSDKTPQAKLKIGDFGVARTLNEESLAKTYVGTPFYMAPEVLALREDDSLRYNESADLWSLGVIVFELIGGNKPFPARDREELNSMHRNEARTRTVVNSLPISEQLKELLVHILRLHPRDRISFEVLCRHPLITGYDYTRPIIDLSGMAAMRSSSSKCCSVEDALTQSEVLIDQARRVAHPYLFYTKACSILRPFLENDQAAKTFLACFAEAKATMGQTDWRSHSFTRLIAERSVQLSKQAVGLGLQSLEGNKLYMQALTLLDLAEESQAVAKFRKVLLKRMALP
jgi:serine/threonine protein kinase